MFFNTTVYLIDFLHVTFFFISNMQFRNVSIFFAIKIYYFKHFHAQVLSPTKVR